MNNYFDKIVQAVEQVSGLTFEEIKNTRRAENVLLRKVICFLAKNMYSYEYIAEKFGQKHSGLVTNMKKFKVEKNLKRRGTLVYPGISELILKVKDNLKINSEKVIERKKALKKEGFDNEQIDKIFEIFNN